ncbi:MAG: Gfo/Idh/MocA family oxidoreductase [bacterium]|nr:Gfo/Idh/MocA family oxidoreductase [bacterium]
MTQEGKVRVAFVGTGGMGQCAHLRNYASIDTCDVVALAEIRPELGRKVAAKYGVPKVYTDYAEMLQKEEVDAIVASQPFTRHGVLLPDLLKYGKPLFTEKPIAASMEVGQRIVQAEKESGAFHMVGYHKRSDPATMYAKDAIESFKTSGELGPLKYVRVLMPEGDWVAGGFFDMVHSDETMPPIEFDAPPSDMDETRFKQYESFVNYYIHQVNLMRHLLGENYHVTYADPTGVVMGVQSESGVPGTLEMTPFKTSVEWMEQALVCFEHGYVKIDLPAPVALSRPGRVEILRDPGDGVTPETVVPTLPFVHAMRQQALNFVAAVRGDMAPLCSSAEALEDLVVAKQYLDAWKGPQS